MSWSSWRRLLIARRERTVIDTNTILSGIIFPGSFPWRAVVQAFETSEVLSSFATQEELREVVRRVKFDRYAALQLRVDAAEEMLADTERVEIRESIIVCRDVKDDKWLELVVSGKADVLITGDADLRALHPFRGIAILSPLDYLAR
jgi:putative PIN family toxin of toxin-antitoxin system